jgi:hypothetical protein
MPLSDFLSIRFRCAVIDADRGPPGFSAGTGGIDAQTLGWRRKPFGAKRSTVCDMTVPALCDHACAGTARPEGSVMMPNSPAVSATRGVAVGRATSQGWVGWMDTAPAILFPHDRAVYQPAVGHQPAPPATSAYFTSANSVPEPYNPFVNGGKINHSRGRAPGVLPLCYRPKPVSRHQSIRESIRAQRVDGP